MATLNKVTFDKENQDILDIDWELWITRNDQPVFFNSLWFDIEGSQLQRCIGGGFSKQLFFQDGDVCWWIRSASDFSCLRKDVRLFIETASKDALDKLFSEAKNQERAVNILLRDVEQCSSKEILGRRKEFIKRISHILLYTTSIPYFLLDALDNTGEENISNAPFIKRECSALRSKSNYHVLKKEVMERMLRIFANYFHITLRQTFLLTQEEFDTSWGNKELEVNGEELRKREKCVYWTLGKGTFFSFNNEVMEHMREVVTPKVVEGISQVTGSTAYRGNVRGIVRIVLGEEDTHTVKEGDVLVAYSTNPTLVPTMKRAGAFVTDEGGISSHAAILARELKKPCIVGTKIATKVLKDGMMVEVDADKGVVRILREGTSS